MSGSTVKPQRKREGRKEGERGGVGVGRGIQIEKERRRRRRERGEIQSVREGLGRDREGGYRVREMGER